MPELVNALDRLDEPVVLVLDDLHEVGDGAAIADLDRLLRHPPPALRIVAATRIDPPLRLGRLRIAGELTDIRERDLAFTQAEADALMRAAEISLEPPEVRLLWERTEGWAAGLRLAALTLRTHPDPPRFVAAFAGDDAAMADYLLAEVLAQQPDDLVDFLLRTSIVDFVCGDLADGLTERTDSDHVLAQLEREHALVTALGDDRPWHRYHPLLRELLRSELRFRHPDDVPGAACARRALVRRGRAPGGGAPPCRRGGRLGARRHARRRALGAAARPRRARPAADAAREPPARARARRPEVALALSATLLDLGDEPAAAELFDARSPAAPRCPRPPRALRPRRGRGRPAPRPVPRRPRKALAHAQAMLGDETASARAEAGSADLRALALVNLGIAQLWTGALDEARRDLEAARRTAEGGERDWLLLVATAHLGTHARAHRAAGACAAHGRRGDRARHAARLARTWPVGLAEGVHSAVALERNRREEAELHFIRCEELLAHASDVPLRMAVRVHRARLLAADGRPEPALEALEGAYEVADGGPSRHRCAAS